ncbi:MAG: hypothetical protein H6662_14290 [Ardenticatenaceae bacterium]|nr:hypothetical protein [Anaerolineales bacterium]MCB8922753.1 hypothetical protein [Ardenticatenaceae bacterium]
MVNDYPQQALKKEILSEGMKGKNYPEITPQTDIIKTNRQMPVTNIVPILASQRNSSEQIHVLIKSESP